MASLTLASLLNAFVVWLYAHVPTTNPLVLAAAVAGTGFLVAKFGGRVAGWLLTAAVTAATVMICARLLGVG